MKRKDLYNYIREEIINELTLAEEIIQYTDNRGEDNIANINPTSPEGVQSIDTLKKNPNIKKVVNTTKNVKLKEATKPDIIKIQNPEKFALAKEIYTAGKIGALLTAVESAGEEGITKTNLGIALNVKDSELSSLLNGLRAAGALSPKREKGIKAAEEEPELPTLSPDEEPEEDDWEVQKTSPDDWETPEEEETPAEEKPEITSDKDTEKIIGKKTNADLSSEEEEKYEIYKTAITNKLKIILDIDKKSSTIDKQKAEAALDNYKKNDSIKKIFAKKGYDLTSQINDKRKELELTKLTKSKK